MREVELFHLGFSCEVIFVQMRVNFTAQQMCRRLTPTAGGQIINAISPCDPAPAVGIAHEFPLPLFGRGIEPGAAADALCSLHMALGLASSSSVSSSSSASLPSALLATFSEAAHLIQACPPVLALLLLLLLLREGPAQELIPSSEKALGAFLAMVPPRLEPSCSTKGSCPRRPQGCERHIQGLVLPLSVAYRGVRQRPVAHCAEPRRVPARFHQSIPCPAVCTVPR